MKPFHMITVPHKDILEGRLSMDVFAANLWEVYQKRGPEEYKNVALFFRKTFLTKGLNNLITLVEKKLKGYGGDTVIQLQTPFGGGKTHSLIALYHKAKEWNAKAFVFVGDKLDPKDNIIWEVLESQLTGHINELKGKTVPSGEKIRKVLESNQPLILLVDELIEYLIASRGIKIENSSFDSQILSFIKRLTEAVSSLDKTVLLITSPSRTQYSEEDQILLNLLVERLGRIEKSYTPVEDYEIADIVRKRLFSEINQQDLENVVLDIVEYFKKENILPIGMESSEYREKFLASYPFLPDVIECFYHKWGSFPTFQRTRGVLRLLSLIIYSVKEKNISYITLADVDLNNQEIRRELVKHIGNEYDSVIAADITDSNSGSKKVDLSLGDSYKGIPIATRSSTTIFLYSFSGGGERGANINEIKRSSSISSIPSSIISEAVELLKDKKLFFVEAQNDRIYFKNTPNLNKIITNRMENIDDKIAINVEKENLSSLSKKGKFKLYIWPSQSNDIPDDIFLKLIILEKKDIPFINSLVEIKGTIPRVNRNTLFFLTPIEVKKSSLYAPIKRKIATEQIEQDKSIKISSEERKKLKESIKQEQELIKTKINEIYRILNIPSKNEIEEIDLGIPAYGDSMNPSDDVFEKLKSEGYIIDKIAPLVLRKKYLIDKNYVSIKNIYENSLKTIGENRLLNKSVLEESIKEGVEKGLFGLGTVENDIITPIYWKEKCSVSFEENEFLIKPSICEDNLKKKEREEEKKKSIKEQQGEKKEKVEKNEGEEAGEIKGEKEKEIEIKEKKRTQLDLQKFIIPKGKVSDIMALFNYIQTRFNKLEIKINASEGTIEESEYKDKIKEAFKQLGIDI